VEWGIGIILVILLFVSYVIVQETRAQMHWRGLVEQGDVEAIRQLVEAEVENWHTSRVPRGVPALLWHGVQTAELTDVSARALRLNCSAEGEYALVEGRRVETSTPLAEGMKITMKLAEMALYDIPNVKLDRVQIDVYTSFRDASGHAETSCILSTSVERSVVEHIDWEEMTAPDFVTLTGGLFYANSSDTIQPVEPLPWQDGTARENLR
jgi:hypothetical protein